MAEKSILKYKEELLQMPRHIEWDGIQVGEMYHFPPVISLSRRDIQITRKDSKENVAYYKIVGDSTNTEMKFASSSILARFIIQKHPY